MKLEISIINRCGRITCILLFYKYTVQASNFLLNKSQFHLLYQFLVKDINKTKKRPLFSKKGLFIYHYSLQQKTIRSLPLMSITTSVFASGKVSRSMSATVSPWPAPTSNPIRNMSFITKGSCSMNRLYKS
jgi:hypothetical protein